MAKTTTIPKPKPKPKKITPGPIYEETGFVQYSPNLGPNVLTGGILQSIPVGSPVSTTQVNPPYSPAYVALGFTTAMATAKSKVMRGDIAAAWACYTANQLSLHLAASLKPANVALPSNIPYSLINEKILDGMNLIAADLARIFPQHMMDQSDKPKRKQRTGLSRQSHKFPKAYPSGGPFKLPIRPKKAAAAE